MSSVLTGPHRTRTIALILAAVVVLAAVGVGIGLLIGRGSGGSTPSARASASQSAPPSAPPLDDTRAKQLSAGLASGTDAGLRAVFDVDAQQPLDPAAVTAIAAMGTLTFDVGTFTDGKDGTATVTATSPATASAPARTWKVLLVARDAQWLISQTEQQ